MSKLYLSFVQKSFKYILFLLFLSNLDASKFIEIEKYLTDIEVVTNYEDRKKGLMFKSSIPQDYGMFFIWPCEKKQCMWMRNTYMPLSVAYINNQGKILEIYDMVPESERSVCSTKRAKYALEVNKDWFEKNNINIGDMLSIRSIVQNDK